MSKTVKPENRVRSTQLATRSLRTGFGRREPFQIRDLELVIPDATTVAVLGPSGCGKTTLLKLIAGLERPDSGQILYDGIDQAGVSTGDRGIGMVFQNYALYPNFTTDENVLAKFRFKSRRPDLDAEAQAKFRQTSELMGVAITDLMGRFPTHLSGGEKQRVAIARCITRDPTVFLMDEPFSNLDLQMRVSYRLKLRQLLEHFGVTTVYVTHDQVEARVLADLIALMRDGHIVQVGSYLELYEHPQSVFAAEFLNLDPATTAINLLDGRVVAADLAGELIGVRPENVTLFDGPAPNTHEGAVESVFEDPLDNRAVVRVSVRGHELDVSTDLDDRVQSGSTTWCRFDRFHVFDRHSGARLKTEDRAGTV